MIINIPINIDEDMFNKAIENDYESKIYNEIIKKIEKALRERSGYYSGRVSDGIVTLVDDQIGNIIDEYKEDIIERAATKLAERLARTKKGKEILDGIQV